jgi:uncharacterized membrane protein
MISAVVTTFLTATVEWVEAFTILLAVALSIGWPRALMAALAALATLAVLTSAGSMALGTIDNLRALQFLVGFLLILFGMRWLGKAIARGAGLKKLNDETAEFASLMARPDIHETRAAFMIAFNGVLLEGLEVWLIVVALGVQTHHTLAASSAALASLLAVLTIGFLVRKPLASVPENTIKFTVGCGILAFGAFWVLQAMGYQWPFGDGALLALFAFNIAAGSAVTQLYKLQIL